MDKQMIGVVELTERDVFSLFSDVDKLNTRFTQSSKDDYILKIKSQLPISCQHLIDNCDVMNNLLRRGT